MKILRIYTDGACSGNQASENFGGWGAVLEYGDRQKELRGGEANTTNNRMEMTALLRAFEAITKENQTVEVFSDSAYLMNCFREKWYENWQKNGWKTTGKKPVENRDLWESLLPFARGHRVRFFRVKGHVNLNSKTLRLEPLFQKFIEWNGGGFSFDDFTYITEMNNRADALANEGVALVKARAADEHLAPANREE